MDTAEYYLTKCRTESMMGGDKIIEINATAYLTDVYAEKGQYAKSLMYSRELLPYLEQMNLQDYLLVVYKSMSKCLAAQGQYKEAFFYLSKKDSLNDIQEREQLTNSIIYLAPPSFQHGWKDEITFTKLQKFSKRYPRRC